MQIILRDDSSGTSVDLILPVDEDDEGRPRWSEFRAPELPPRQTQGELSFTSQDPLKDFVWSQDSWHKGAMQPYYRADDPFRYAYSENIDLRWEGVATLSDVQLPYSDGSKQADGSPTDYGDVIIQNHGAELAAATGWTQGTGVTLSVDSSNANSGSYAFKLVTDGSRSAGDVLMSQDVVDATDSPTSVWQGNTMSSLSVLIKVSSGAESGANLKIDDGVGNDTGTAVTASTFTSSTISTFGINGAASKMSVEIIQASNETGAHTYYVDDFAMTPDSGDLVPNIVNTSSHNAHFANGANVFHWVEADEVWRLGGWFGADITDLVEFNGNVFAALGYSTAYEYGSKASWTTSTEGGNDKFAKFFAVARNGAGAFALWKSETSSSVAESTNPVNSGDTWSAPITVGTTSPTITRLYGAFDTLIVGKEDGLYQYVRFDVSNSAGDDLFFNVAPDFEALQDVTNFSRGATWAGWLWLKTVRQGLVRWRPGELQIVSFLRAPRVDSVGGLVLDMVSDAEQLWVLIGTTSDQNAGTFLISIRLDKDGQPLVHTVQAIVGLVITTEAGGAVGVMSTADVGTTPTWLVVMQASLQPYRWTINTTDPVPYRAGLNDDGGEVYAGQLFTSIWHGDMPDTQKAFLSLTVWVEDVGASDTIAAAFALEGSTSFTSLGTYNGAGRIQTLYFNGITTPATNAIGRMIQLRFTWSQSAGGTPPKMYAFALHSTLRPAKLRTWEIFVRVQSEAALDSGYRNPIHLTKVLADLTTLEDQVYPIYYVEDIDDDGNFVNTTVHLLDRQRVAVEPTYEVHRLILQEAHTSA